MISKKLAIHAIMLAFSSIYLAMAGDAFAIVNGVEDKEDRMDFVVRIVLEGMAEGVCSGVAVNSNTIFTAAHCFGPSREDFEKKTARPVRVEVVRSNSVESHNIISAKIAKEYHNSEFFNRSGIFDKQKEKEFFARNDLTDELVLRHHVLVSEGEAKRASHDLAILKISGNLGLNYYPNTIDQYIDISGEVDKMGKANSLLIQLASLVQSGSVPFKKGKGIEVLYAGFGISLCPNLENLEEFYTIDSNKECSSDKKRRYGIGYLAVESYCSIGFVSQQKNSIMAFAPWCVNENKAHSRSASGDSGGPVLMRYRDGYIVLGLISSTENKEGAWSGLIDGVREKYERWKGFMQASTLIKNFDTVQPREWIEIKY